MIEDRKYQLITITEVLDAISTQNYDRKLPLSRQDDFYNAVATAINALIENLEERVVEKTLLEKSEARLKAAKERLDQTLEQALDAVITVNQHKKITFFNEAAEKMFGYSKEEVLNKNVAILIPLEFKRRYESLLNQSLGSFEFEDDQKIISDFNLIKKSGNWFWGNISLSRIKYQEEILITFFIKDITEKRAHQDDIKRINRLLKAKNKSDSSELERVNTIIELVLGNLPVQFITFNKSGHVNYSKGAKLIDNKGKLEGENILRLFDRYSDIAKLFKNLQSGKEGKFTIESNGKYLDVMVSPNYDSNGKLIHYGCIVADATDIMIAQLKTKEAYDREKEVSMMKSKFIEGVSHQFRTPLTSIQSNFELFQIYINKRELPDKNLAKLMIGRITSGIKDITDLLSNMLLLNEDESKHKNFIRPYDLTEICREQLNLIQPNTFEVVGKPRKIAINKDTFSKALYEIFNNASKFSNGQPFEVALKFLKKEVIITVKDQGIGIEENELDKIFEPYHRAEDVIGFPGKGTGLTIAKKYIYTNQGKVWAESIDRQGTQFHILLDQ